MKQEIESFIKNQDVEGLALFVKENNLEIQDGKIILPNANVIAEEQDRLQHLRKILLNSLYGALLNPHCRFYDERIGQSVTLTGRCTTQHMASKVNEIVTNEYDYTGKAVTYGDTDSNFGDTIINCNLGKKEIQYLFEQSPKKDSIGDLEFAYDDDLQVLSYDPHQDKEYYGNIQYIYRRKVNKAQYLIEDENGNQVRVTGDHSIMVERNGELQSIEANNLKKDDVLITIIDDEEIRTMEA